MQHVEKNSCRNKGDKARHVALLTLCNQEDIPVLLPKRGAGTSCTSAKKQSA